MNTFYCVDCKLTKPCQTEGGTGYASLRDTNETICYLCCAIRDRNTMVDRGDSRNLPLYINKAIFSNELQPEWKISNWCGTLEFRPFAHTTGKHNIGRTRDDFWFYGPDGHVWHGVQIGDFNQILHARRTKEIVRAVAHC